MRVFRENTYESNQFAATGKRGRDGAAARPQPRDGPAAARARGPRSNRQCAAPRRGTGGSERLHGPKTQTCSTCGNSHVAAQHTLTKAPWQTKRRERRNGVRLHMRARGAQARAAQQVFTLAAAQQSGHAL